MTDLNDVIERLRQTGGLMLMPAYNTSTEYGRGHRDGQEYVLSQMMPIIRDLEALRDEQSNDLPPT